MTGSYLGNFLQDTFPANTYIQRSANSSPADAEAKAISNRYVSPSSLVNFSVLTQTQEYTRAQRFSVVTVPSAASITLNFANSNFFSIDPVDHDITLNNPTGMPETGTSQYFSIYFKQGSTGGTISYGNTFVSKSGSDNTLSVGNNAVDVLHGVVLPSGNVEITMNKNIS